MSFCHVKILEYFPWQKYIVVAMAELFGTHPSANYLGITSLDQDNGAWQRNFMDHDIFSVLSTVFFNLLLVSFFIALFSTQSWMLYMYLPWLITLRNMTIFELFCFLCYYSNMWQFVWSKYGNFYKNSMANFEYAFAMTSLNHLFLSFNHTHGYFITRKMAIFMKIAWQIWMCICQGIFKSVYFFVLLFT